ncbi:MAG: hypothetical protein SGBAC_005468 [Bacillariaceae sp.]
MPRVYPNGMALTSIMDSLDDDADDNKHLISVLSMNLLAPLYVRPIDKRTGQVQPFAAFEWVQDDAILEWDTRKLRLLEYMLASEAEVICLQELQLERQEKTSEGENNESLTTDPPLVLPQWIQPMVQTHGYRAILPPQDSLDHIAKRNLRVLGSDSAVTNAILVKKDQWKVLEEPEEEEETEPVKKKSKKDRGGVQRISSSKNSNTMVSVCLQPASSKHEATIDPVVISCVHLDATDERKRILQLTKCLERSRNLLNHQGKDDSSILLPLRAIITGDMNAEFVPGSCMMATLKGYQRKKRQALHESSSSPSDTSIESDDEAMAEVSACTEALRLTCTEPPTKEQLKDWRQLRQEAYDLVQDNCVSLDRVPTGPTRCAYGHSTQRDMESWKLDHLLYTCSNDDENDCEDSVRGVRPLAYWATLEADATSSQTGLPNASCPSDHLPIAAVFQIPLSVSPSAKDREVSSTFLQLVQDLEQRHKEVIQQAKAELKAKENELQQKELRKQKKAVIMQGPAVADNSKQGKKKKKGNQKRGPPSTEMMEMKREFRARLKSVQKNQVQEREGLIRDMGNREKLLLQGHFGIPWRQWLEQGPP